MFAKTSDKIEKWKTVFKEEIEKITGEPIASFNMDMSYAQLLEHVPQAFTSINNMIHTATKKVGCFTLEERQPFNNGLYNQAIGLGSILHNEKLFRENGVQEDFAGFEIKIAYDTAYVQSRPYRRTNATWHDGAHMKAVYHENASLIEVSYETEDEEILSLPDAFWYDVQKISRNSPEIYYNFITVKPQRYIEGEFPQRGRKLINQ